LFGLDCSQSLFSCSRIGKHAKNRECCGVRSERWAARLRSHGSRHSPFFASSLLSPWTARSLLIASLFEWSYSIQILQSVTYTWRKVSAQAYMGGEPVNIVLRGTAYLKRTLTSIWRIFFKDTISILTREQHFWLLITNHFWIFITRINIGNWKCQIIENRTSPHNINQWHVVSSRKWNWAELKRVHPHSSERELCLPWSIDISFSTIFVAKN